MFHELRGNGAGRKHGAANVMGPKLDARTPSYCSHLMFTSVRWAEEKPVQTASRLALPISRAIASRGERVRALEDLCPSTFSIEIGNERTRVPVA